MAKRKKKRIASRGSVNTTILKTLVNGDKYGYEIIKEVELYSDGKIQLKQPSLYSSLSRFEEKGIVSSYWGDSDIGGRRHYYHLTDKGHQYYKVSVLKIKSDDQDLDEEANINVVKESNNSEINTNSSDTIPNEKSAEIVMTEIKEDELPAIINFDEKSIETKELEQTTPDHVFNTITPLEQIVNNENNSDEFINQQEDKSNKEKLWNDLIARVKNNNRLCNQTSYKKLHYKKPVKTKKVILDKDGIYKLRDQDYIPSNHTAPIRSKIVDNVGKRISSNNYYDSIYGKKETKLSNTKEITNEEKLRRNQSFEERFNILTQSKLKPSKPEPSPIISTSPIADKEPEIDYRSKLDKLLNLQPQQSKEHSNEIQLEENNLFNYIDEESDNNISSNTVDNNEEIEDKFINFDSEDFEIKSENKKYIEEISNFSTTQESIKINRYENKSYSNNIESKTFVLINKVKSIFGVILLLLGVLELTVSLVYFKNSNLMQENDLKIFIVGFILVSLISLSFILPVIFNSREHKLNTFKLKYTEILGILTFLVSLILIYCINALIGFELDNFNYFAVELIVPAILTFNFVITPPIYSAIINCKKFYD